MFSRHHIGPIGVRMAFLPSHFRVCRELVHDDKSNPQMKIAAKAIDILFMAFKLHKPLLIIEMYSCARHPKKIERGLTSLFYNRNLNFIFVFNLYIT
jgi:hypothetical protein